MRVANSHRALSALSLALAAAVTAALLGAAAHADPGDPVIPGQGDIDRAKADVQARKAVADRIQSALDAADRRLRTLEADAGLAAEAYDTAALKAATAAREAGDAQNRAVQACVAQTAAEERLGVFAADMYRQGPDMGRLAALLHAKTLREFADRQKALANASEAEAAAVKDARYAAWAAADAQRKAEQAAAEQRDAEEQARAARDLAQAAAGAEQTEVAGIKAREDLLLGQLAAAQGVEVALERQRRQGLAELAAREAAQRAAAAGHGMALGPVPYAEGAVRAMLNYIYAQLGKPYVWGGAGPDVFDCSGLAMRGLEAAGWEFPHPAQWQYLEMHPLTYDQLRPGDLVFWAENDADPHTIYHEAIFIGNDRIIQAPRPGGVVEVQSLWVNGTPSFYGRP